MDIRSTSTGQNGAPVTPSDTTVVGARALWVGGAGTVIVDFKDGNTNVSFPGVPAGTHLQIAAYRVKAATSATNIVAIY